MQNAADVAITRVYVSVVCASSYRSAGSLLVNSTLEMREYREKLSRNRWCRGDKDGPRVRGGRDVHTYYIRTYVRTYVQQQPSSGTLLAADPVIILFTSSSLSLSICTSAPVSPREARSAPFGTFAARARQQGRVSFASPVCLHYSAMQIDRRARIIIIRFNICSLSRRYYNSSRRRPRVYPAICQPGLDARVRVAKMHD